MLKGKYNCSGCYSAQAIQRLKKSKRAAWEYIKSIPEENQPGAIGAVQLTLKRKG